MAEPRRLFRVEWSPSALHDVERIASFLVEEAPLRAEAIIERILGRAESSSTSPNRGRRIPELRGVADSSWRELIEAPWRIVYQIRSAERRVMIHAVLDGRRDLEDLLLERLLSS